MRTVARLLLLVLATSTSLAYGQSTETLRSFDAGNRFYQDGDYAAALDAYLAAEDAGHTSAALYYNLGNAYFRLDQLGQAIRHYERARRLLPDDRTLAHNLEVAQARAVDQFSQVPTPFWVRWWRGVVAVIGIGGFFAIGLVAYLLAAALLGYRLWTGVRNDWLRRGVAVASLFGLLFLAAAFGASVDRTMNRQAVLLDDVTTLRTQPLPDAEPLQPLHEGVILDLLRTQDHWVEVRLPNGVTGWLQYEALGEI